MDLYFVRHGQSEANLNKIIQGHLDSPLSEKGRKQAIELKEYLPKNFDWVISSDLIRTIETAHLTSGVKVDQISKFSEFREINAGELEGKKATEININPEDHRLWLEFNEDRLHEKYGTEPINNFIERCVSKLESIIEQAKSENLNKILLVTHGGVMKAILDKHLKITNKRFLNTEMIRINNKQGSWQLIERKTNSV
jgi:broad specificity phosphatase PhoE